MKDTLSFLVQSLLKKNKIKIDEEELIFQIQSHPSYPSLHAITGVLNHFDVENAAVKVPVNEEVLSQLPKSFIAQIIRDEVVHFALVINKGLEYKVIISNKDNETVSLQTFLEQFTGVIVGVEKDDTENVNAIKTNKFKQILFGISMALFVFLFFKSSPNIDAFLYFTFSLIGIVISCLIIQHDLGIGSKIIDNICSQESKVTNCNAVLKSKGARLYKNIKLSDVSLVYFMSISVASLLLSLTNNSLNLLYIISLIGFPIIVYSIYYQIVVSKNWCVLCLGIASVLVLQASIFFFTYSSFSGLNIESVLLIGFSFVTISSLWFFASSKLKQEQKFKKLKMESAKFKRNFEVFNTLLNQSDIVNTTIVNTPEIILGNKNAALNITIVTNPFCGHCKSVHNLVETILKRYHNEVSITIRFNVNTSNIESKGVKVSSRLLEIYHIEGEVTCLEALHDIYANDEVKSWLNKWEESKSKTTYINALKKESNWCLDNSLNFTPELLINGRTFPKVYDRKELIYFIEDLVEFYNQNIDTSFMLKHN